MMGAETGAELFKAARRALGLSANAMARALRLSDGRLIRRWEAGEYPVSGPAWVALGYMLRERGFAELADKITAPPAEHAPGTAA